MFRLMSKRFIRGFQSTKLPTLKYFHSSRITHRQPPTSTLRSYIKSPTVPLLFLLGIVASELMYIIKIRNESETTTFKLESRISLLSDLISRIKKGEDIDVEKELANVDQTSIDKTFEDVLKELQEAEEIWIKKHRESKETVVEGTTDALVVQPPVEPPVELKERANPTGSLLIPAQEPESERPPVRTSKFL